MYSPAWIKDAIKSILQLMWGKKRYKFAIKKWMSLEDLKSCESVLRTMRFSVNMEPLELARPAGDRILIVAPHPDDEMLGLGGTLIKSLQGGASVRVLYLTSGKPNEAEGLEEETTRVSERIGYEIEFLRYPNNGISVDAASIAQFGKRIQDFRPECLFLPVLFDDHDDHRRASHLFAETYKRGGIASNMEVWGYQVYSVLMPNVIVDITEEAVLKREAVNMWESQSLHRDWAHYIMGMNAFNVRWLKTRGPRYVETFFVLPAREYVELWSHYFVQGPRSVYYQQNYW